MFNCNCKWTQTVLGLAILAVTLWPNLVGANASKWVVVIAAILVLGHGWGCKNCSVHMAEMPARKRRR